MGMSHIIDQPIDTRHGGGDVFPGHAGRFRRNETTCVESGNFKESQREGAASFGKAGKG